MSKSTQLGISYKKSNVGSWENINHVASLWQCNAQVQTSATMAHWRCDGGGGSAITKEFSVKMKHFR